MSDDFMTAAEHTNALVSVMAQKAIAEVQARITVAQTRPRDWSKVRQQVLRAVNPLAGNHNAIRREYGRGRDNDWPERSR